MSHLLRGTLDRLAFRQHVLEGSNTEGSGDVDDGKPKADTGGGDVDDGKPKTDTGASSTQHDDTGKPIDARGVAASVVSRGGDDVGDAEVGRGWAAAEVARGGAAADVARGGTAATEDSDSSDEAYRRVEARRAFWRSLLLVK